MGETTSVQERTVPTDAGYKVAPKEAFGRTSCETICLLDVRGFDEFAAGHAPDALCIPLADLERRAGQIPTDRPVFAMCASGGRSAMAVERLRSLGFDNVYDIEGGFDAWTKAGLPAVQQKGIIPLERQVRGVAGTMVFVFTLASLLVHPGFASVPLFVGFMLFLSSVTGLCPMLSLLKRMPWNRVAAGADGNSGCQA